MKCRKPLFASVSVLFAVLLSSNLGALNAQGPDLTSLTFVRAQTGKPQCSNACQARFRNCLSLKQIPSLECRGVYRDCVRFTCGPP
jgi:hypothetical protein